VEGLDEEFSDGDVEDDLGLLFPPFTGTGIYLLASCLNHSCTPNAEVLDKIGFLEEQKESKEEQKEEVTRAMERSDVVIRALKDIPPGDEIMISYIADVCPDTSLRQIKLLHPYLFVCDCPLCLEE